ncbi:uncharacterized protein DUF1153 [Litoreibacter ponti]|uniref:Uncharacterized protein DUF1153 n=1 Tax=Litoreibacter ponti TaxID=1510457 RepID=A0A2T6BIC6_9RHOB|nr:DUF1153 domain-containing protein [Litoreibacter ponti]PTX55809.1 uncharacterized protein DUF1153 [Litoreibacter ponti]
MYLKKETGPRMVTLPDGKTISRADLPDPATRRWVASRKAMVVRAVDAQLVTPEEACAMYDLSEEELASWRNAVADHGVKALRATSLQAYRQNDA